MGTTTKEPANMFQWNWAAWVAPILMPISFLMDLFQYWAIQWR
jgi:hypothetical protein